MIVLLTFLAIISFPGGMDAESSCPEKYKTLSEDHTFCLPENTNCKSLKRGITDKSEIQQILDLHNEFRNKVATGKESGASDGELPSAANMLEMTWDDEFAEIAQKWADQCHFELKHDKSEQRATENLSAGQNMFYMENSCSGDECKADWKMAIEGFYSEVKDVNKGIIESFGDSGQGVVGHFTQLIWAESHKLGCGYFSFEGNDGTVHTYVCNYGPAGNFMGEKVYEQGEACSKCPENSSCDKDKYPGLCLMKS